MNRKTKYQLSGISRDFYNMVVPRAMVSLRFMTNETLQNKLFKNQLGRFVKVSKLNIEDLQIYSTNVAANFAGAIAENQHFCSRLEELEFRNIEFSCE